MGELAATKKNVYRVQGFSCANCAAKFESNVKQLPHVEDAQVNFGAAKITVIGEASVKELEQAGAFEGLRVVSEEEMVSLGRKPFWQRRQSYVMLVSLLLLAVGLTFGEQAIIGKMMFALSIAIGGYALFVKGLRGLMQLNFSMNTLMTIAIIGAALIGEWREGAVVVILFAISEALESYSMDKARQSIRSLMDAAPKEAWIRRDGLERIVAVDDILVGDVMIVKPGEKLAMDGIVVKGASAVNQAAITGESIPVSKQTGDEVFAGTLNGEGSLEVQVTKTAEDTTIAKIIHLVEEAQAEKAPSQKFVDTFAKYYTPAIMALALLIAVVPPLVFGALWHDWLYNALALLVVGCPCALVISTPVAIVTAIGTAARNGVLIKGGIHLEEMSKVTAMAFDKTGTLTNGEPIITDVIRLAGPSAEQSLLIAARIERLSQHPLAAAVVRKAEALTAELQHRMSPHDPKAMLQPAESFVSLTGKGARASVDGTTYWIGSPNMFRELSRIPETVQREVERLQAEGKTVIILGTEDEMLALFAARDEVRESSSSVIQQLHATGIKRTVMLTGDNQMTAKAIGGELGLREVYAELLPEEKLAVIDRLQREGEFTAMVGDGVNDAPALAKASIGIAMGGAGTDTALETADIALMGDDLSKLPLVIRLSRHTMSIIKQNITFSLVVKAAALALIGPGWLTLWLAIFADMGATLIVTLNALRLLRVRAKHSFDQGE